MGRSNIPYKCTMKGCNGKYVQSETNPDYYVCNLCGVGIWRDIKLPPVKEIMERGYSIQRLFGLNTREIKARLKNKGRSTSGRSRRRKKVYYVRKPLDL